MKRILRIAGAILGLLVLGLLALALALIFRGLRKPIEPASQVFQSPLRTPPAAPSPTVPLTMTRGPKPTLIPSPLPSVTSMPTPLALPPSAFYALWAESFPEGQGTVFWLADPRDVGSRREVLRFERDAIVDTALSPNTRQLAVITTYGKTVTLWVANADGSELRQLDQGPGVGGPLFWSRDNRLLAYRVSWREEIPAPGYKSGTPAVIPVSRGTVVLVEVISGEKQRLLEAESNIPLSVLGWSANGQELYYLRAIPQEVGYQYSMWGVDRNSRKTRELVSLGNEATVPILSPDGTQFLLGAPEGLSIMSADGRDRQVIPEPGRGFMTIWSPNSKDLVMNYREPGNSRMIIRALDVQTRASRNLSALGLAGDWRPLTISSDFHWLAAYHYYTGIHWIHLATGLTVPLSSQDHRVIFVAWVPRSAASEEDPDELRMARITSNHRRYGGRAVSWS